MRELWRGCGGGWRRGVGRAGRRGAGKRGVGCGVDGGELGVRRRWRDAIIEVLRGVGRGVGAGMGLVWGHFESDDFFFFFFFFLFGGGGGGGEVSIYDFNPDTDYVK